MDKIDRFEFELSIDGAEKVRVEGGTIRDALDGVYSVELDCRIGEKRGGDIQSISETLPRTDAQLKLKREDGFEETISGVVVSVERGATPYTPAAEREGEGGGSNAEARENRFFVRLAPAFELLRLHTAGCGTWHEMSLADILEEVLSEPLQAMGRTLECKVSNTDKVPSITRPPGESLRDFAQRLMRLGGINAFYRHDGPREVLVLCDTNDQFVPRTPRGKERPLRVADAQGVTTAENIISLSTRVPALPSTYEVASFDTVGCPSQPLTGEAQYDGVKGLKTRAYGIIRPTESGDPELQHKRTAEVELEHALTLRHEVIATTSCIGLLAGRTIDIELRPNETRSYVVRSVEARGGKAFADDGGYENEVVLVPLVTPDGEAVPVRATNPSPNEGPKMAGITLAEVVSIKEPAVECDEYMRVRVRYMFDEVKSESPLTWVPVMQSMAGLHGGSQWVPPVGTHVVVGFFDGRPDQPCVIGAIYNAQHRPPPMGPPDRAAVLPDSSMVLGWNHASIDPASGPDGQGSLDRQTRLCMDVTANQEMFFVGAPYDYRADVGHDSELNVENDSTIEIGNTLAEKVGGDASYEVGGSRQTKVGGSDATNVSDAWSVKASSVSIQANSAKFNVGGSSISIGGSGVNESVGGSWKQHASALYSVSSSASIMMRAPVIALTQGSIGGGASGPGTGSGLSLKATAKLSGSSSAVLEAPSASVVAGTQGVVGQGKAISLKDAAGGSAKLEDGSLVVDVPRGVTFRCGNTELRLGPDGIHIDGRRVTITAADTVVETDRFDVTGENS